MMLCYGVFEVGDRFLSMEVSNVDKIFRPIYFEKYYILEIIFWSSTTYQEGHSPIDNILDTTYTILIVVSKLHNFAATFVVNLLSID